MIGRPLSDLDAVPWAKLIHAYGKAVDVPDQLRALASTRKKARTDALAALYGNIFHQGSRYPASAAATPFLVGLLTDRGVRDKASILVLVNHLAVGYHAEHLADGFDFTAPEVRRLYRGRGATPYRRCYEAARDGGAVYLELLDDPAADVRCAAAFVLAFLREHADDSLLRLRARVPQERDAAAKGSMILALGMLSRLVGSREDAPWLHSFATDGGSLVTGSPRERRSIAGPLLRLCASIALVYVDPAGLSESERAILAGASRLDTLSSTSLPWNDGDLVGYANVMLQVLSRSAGADGAFQDLLSALRVADRETGLQTATSVLGLVFEGGRPDPRRRHLPEELDGRQRQALETLVASDGAWHYGNLNLLLAEMGLPSEREDLARFLGVGAPGLYSRPLTLPDGTGTKTRSAFVWFWLLDDDLASPARLSEAICETLRPAEAIDLCLDLVGHSMRRVELTLLAMDRLGDAAWAPLRERAEVLLHARPALDFGPATCTAIGLARLASRRGVELEPELEPLLQKAFSVPKHARAAARELLLALPVERRAALLIDNRFEQWDMYPLAPTMPMLAKVLERICAWGPQQLADQGSRALELVTSIGQPALAMITERLAGGRAPQRRFLEMARRHLQGSRDH